MSITKTLSIAAAAALGMAATAAPAMAAFPPNTSLTLTGTLTLSQSVTIDCDVSVDISVDASGVPTITGRSFAPGSFLCGGVVQPAGTWDITLGPGPSAVTLTIGATSILGSCSDTVVAALSGTSITFNNVVVAGAPSNCTVDGTLS